jgi:hypothetical protein
MTKKVLLALLIVGLLIATSVGAIGISIKSSKIGNEKRVSFVKTTNNLPDFAPGRVIVGFKKAKNIESIASKYNFDKDIISKNEKIGFAVVKVREGEEFSFIESIKNKPGIKYAEPDWIVHATFTPNDPFWDQQWGPAMIKCTKAWDRTKGSKSVKIAIVDTGVDYTHEDLAANYVSGGYDFVNDDDDPRDDNGHGTHCAGIAAAVMNNNKGIAGVAQVSIMAEKVLDADGYGYASDVADGIVHAADSGADIISMSLGGPGSSTEEDACNYAWNKDVLLVAAAGNDGAPQVSYPAGYSSVIAVGAIDSNSKRCSWSNYGDKLELMAPGDAIVSTIPGDRYEYYSGTSMATPHVAGVAALAKSLHPDYSNQQIRNLLRSTADDLGDPSKDIYYGYGRVDASFDDQDSPLVPKINIKIHKITKIDPIDPIIDPKPEWFYRVTAISGGKEELAQNQNGENKKFLFWYIFIWNSEDTWIVDKTHQLSAYEPNVQVKIKLMEYDLLSPNDVADISSNSERKTFVATYDMIENKLLSGSDKTEKDGKWLVANGEFDGTTDEDDDDAKIWFEITDTYDPPKPDLEAEGNLRWDDVKPGGTVYGSIYVKNAGESDPYGWCENKLNWRVESWPNWGQWSFSPKSGENLKPEDGKVEIKVTVKAPNEKNQAFSGKIKIVNTDNPNDYAYISVSLVTPKNRNNNFVDAFSFFWNWIKNIFYR